MEGEHPYLTLILPIRNEFQFLSKALSSIINQKFPVNNFEIIISDGGSTDGTLEIINSIIQDNSNVYLIDNPQKIVSTGFNLALNKAKGDIIIRVDGHCEISPDYLEKCNNLLKSNDADIVGGVIDTISTGLIGMLFLLPNHLVLG